MILKEEEERKKDRKKEKKTFVFAFLRSRLGDTRMTKSDGEKEFDEPEAEPPPEASQSKVFDPRVESLEF